MRHLITLLCTLLLALPLTAQTLTGTWENGGKMQEDGLDAIVLAQLILKADGTYDQNLTMELTMKADETITFHTTLYFDVPGRWTRNGDLLSLAPVARNVKAEIVKTDMPDLLRDLLLSEIQKETMATLKAPSKLLIVSLTSSILAVRDADDPADEVDEYVRAD